MCATNRVVSVVGVTPNLLILGIRVLESDFDRNLVDDPFLLWGGILDFLLDVNGGVFDRLILVQPGNVLRNATLVLENFTAPDRSSTSEISSPLQRYAISRNRSTSVS